MRIIKPYGRSHTENDGSKAVRLVLRVHPPSGQRLDIEDFAETHDELAIAQWISTVDKIATRPIGKSGPKDEKRQFPS